MMLVITSKRLVNRPFFWAGVLLVSIATSAAAATAAPIIPRFAPVFTDHMVLQRDRPVALWGSAAPGSILSVAIGSTKRRVATDASSRWRIVLPPVHYRKAVTLSVAGAEGGATVRDVVLGDVYLCAGQSNMEFALRESDGGREAIADARDVGLRLLHIPPRGAGVAVDSSDFTAQWRRASPDTAGDFSAVCFYAGEALRRRRSHVPVGLIETAVGGSSITAWLSNAGYLAAGRDPARLALARQSSLDPPGALRAWSLQWEAWWNPGAGPIFGQPWRPGYQPDSRWRDEPRKGFWSGWDGSEAAGHLGSMWYRKTIALSRDQAAAATTLDLGVIHEMDHTWINGRLVGATYGYDATRRYRIPAGLLREGGNEIVVEIDSQWTSGGFRADAQRALNLRDVETVRLDDGWRYLTMPDWIGATPRPPWNLLSGASTLYNAMVAPLGQTPLAGIFWYQGESDADDAEHYPAALTALMADWRKQFGATTPFYVVQLPRYGAGRSAYASAWARLREAQRLVTQRDERTKLVVTIDLGDPDKIHPPAKRVFGERLAAAVAEQAAGRPISPTAVRSGDRVTIALGDPRNRIHSLAGAPGPFLACRGDLWDCRPVAARLEGQTVVIGGLLPDERLVRYCWGDSPRCDLVDDGGVPISPFKIEAGPGGDRRAANGWTG